MKIYRTIKQKLIAAIADLEIILKVLVKGLFMYRKNTRPAKLGEKIVLLGNGPSAQLYFKHQDQFKDYDLLVVNMFPLKSPDFMKLKPKYMCVLSGTFYYVGSGILHERHKVEKKDIEALCEVLAKVDWPLKIITDGRKLPVENANFEYIYLSSTTYGESLSKSLEKNFFLKNWATYRLQNVMIGALYFAIIFGFKEIALFGVEQNRLQILKVDESNVLYQECDYFYEVLKATVSAPYESEVSNMAHCLIGFKKAAEYANAAGGNITNYTLNSYIQNFKKKRLDVSEANDDKNGI